MLTVERLADHLRHDLQWAVFRAPSLSTAPQQTFEIAAGFSLNVAAPHRFNIQFHDSTTGERVRQPLTEVQRLWTEYVQAEGIVLRDVPPGQMPATYQTFNEARLPDIAPLFQLIERQFYWIEGAYRLTITLTTSAPTRQYSFNYTFRLSEAESRLLRLNVVGCLQATCNVPNVVFNFVFPQYQRV